jgi:sugar O-acyltransferase (sialic acid O-acetyltransferase NeuD family)
MNKLIVFGTGDIAKLAHYYFSCDSEYEVTAFTVDKEYMTGDVFLGLPVVDFEKIVDRCPPETHKIFIALSYAKMNRIRAQKYYKAKELGYELATYVSSRCAFLTDKPVGDNCFILEDNTIQPFVEIGNNVTLWSGSHIGHDSVIEDHCFIAPCVVISGHVHIHKYCFIGVNATLRNSITIAPETLIGAGAIIMKDTVEKGVYIPQSAQLLGKKSDKIKL